MAGLGVQSMFSLRPATSLRCRASLHTPIDPKRKSVYIPKLPTGMINMDELVVLREDEGMQASTSNNISSTGRVSDRNVNMLITKLNTIAEAVADRAEMHSIIGEQRNDWNALFLNSINSITLTASLMAGVAAIPIGDETPYILPLKVSSVILFTAAAGMMAAVNKIQPSQLAEEQRNATRLFKQLERSIRTTLALRNPMELDVEEALERINAIERAYPLPLLPLPDKFPKVLKPTVWWPKLNLKKNQQQQQQKKRSDNNGWSVELEEEMAGILRVLKTKDQEQYMTCGELVTNINRTLAVSGPILAAVAAIGTGLIGSSTVHEPWPALIGVVGGALATVVNTLEHGGQMGMVFELFRNCAGYYVRLEEEIENNLGERDVQKREDGELFRMKMALHLGRSLSELEGFASYASASCEDDDIKEFAGKLF
ncbi:putative F-box protein [Iris pallida]|uniref:F-box protein n=1 Tax=Iris pallida TaxID=29817 RepID=A0AAX6HN51_IRIPA|nr:putative F-box protein [Iris pallida]KAJ6842233.1 putative F-box protein [Iris pallida]KAJ6848157.1 putative F-box protein [Iris pallida]